MFILTYLPGLRFYHPSSHCRSSRSSYTSVETALLGAHLPVLPSLVGWLNGFNAELSLKRYWRGQRSQDVGKEGDCRPTYCHTVTTTMTPALTWGSDESHFNVPLIVRNVVTKAVSMNGNRRRERRAEAESKPRSLCLPTSLTPCR